MGGINIGRWLAGGIAAAVVTFLMEGLWSTMYMEQAEAAMANLGLTMDMTGATWVLAIVVSLILGMALVFFYAMARPRFGPGPLTAIKVTVAFWIGGYLLQLIGYHMAGFYPGSLLVMWGWQGLVSMVLATVVGGWIYKEES
ncbi:MAG: hypothetical protein HKO65_06610 [Gemmatimonadetes bacterium]|nr:hypothetical protein [Gemmatimonadota bacterium]NNM04760.1 hypothetical protein [Gemmatimonadota bacterium]